MSTEAGKEKRKASIVSRRVLLASLATSGLLALALPGIHQVHAQVVTPPEKLSGPERAAQATRLRNTFVQHVKAPNQDEVTNLIDRLTKTDLPEEGLFLTKGPTRLLNMAYHSVGAAALNLTPDRLTFAVNMAEGSIEKIVTPPANLEDLKDRFTWPAAGARTRVPIRRGTYAYIQNPSSGPQLAELLVKVFGDNVEPGKIRTGSESGYVQSYNFAEYVGGSERPFSYFVNSFGLAIVSPRTGTMAS